MIMNVIVSILKTMARLAIFLGKIRMFVASRAQGNKFATDNGGNVALIFAIVLAPLLLSTAVAIDYSRYAKNYSKLLNSADSALLAASVVMSSNLDMEEDQLQALLEAEFDRFMSANFQGEQDDSTFTRNLSFNRDARTVAVDVGLTQQSVYKDLFGDTQFFDNKVYGEKKYYGSKSLSTVLTTTVENYVLDIVMCIDATGSMGATLASVQQNAATFDAQLRAELGISANDERFKIRVRPIYFRDWVDTYYHSYYPWYYRDGLIPASDFYDLDDAGETSGFQTFLNSESASAGFDLPEASGACMNEAMRSNWYDVTNQTDFPVDENLTVFPIIVVWTDNAIQQLSLTQQYMSPTQPTNYASFEAQWDNPAIIPQDPKLLILFGPENYAGWSTVKTWRNYVHGGGIGTGNTDAIGVIADNITQFLPDALRLTH